MGEKMEVAEFQRIIKRLISITELQRETLNMMNSPKIRQIWSNMFAEEVALILNDSISNWYYSDTPALPGIFSMEGERVGKLKIIASSTGITIEKDNPDISTMYYTVTDAPPIIEENKLLKYLWPEQIFMLIYGIVERKFLNTNCIYYLVRNSATSNSYDILIAKTSPSKDDSNIINHELLWGDGEIYAVALQLNKPTIPNCVRIQKSHLLDLSW